MMKENIIGCLENATLVNSPVVAFVTGVKTVAFEVSPLASLRSVVPRSTELAHEQHLPAQGLFDPRTLAATCRSFLRRPWPQSPPAGTSKSVDHAAHPHFKADQAPQLGRIVGKTRFVLLHQLFDKCRIEQTAPAQAIGTEHVAHQRAGLIA